MTLSLNIGNLFNDSSSHALVDELRKRTTEEEILDFEKKFNSKNEKNLHIGDRRQRQMCIRDRIYIPLYLLVQRVI